MPHYDPEGTTTKEWDIGTEGSPRRATIRDVAAHAGVSRSAVSKVFNAKGGISPATEARIRESARALNWAPSASAAALASDSTRTVGLVIRRGPDLLFADPHFALLIGGVEEILVPAGYGLQLHLIGEDRELERGLYTRLATQRRVDGVLLTESELGDPRHALLDELGLPSVMLGWPDPEEEQRWNVVSAHPSEHRTAYHEAARHLTDLGHRRVAYVSGPERLVHTGYRRREFERELTRNGAELVTRVHLDFSVEQVVEACLSMVDGPRPPPRSPSPTTRWRWRRSAPSARVGSGCRRTSPSSGTTTCRRASGPTPASRPSPRTCAAWHGRRPSSSFASSATRRWATSR